MSQNLTLKERIELFKLSKKPRKQIIIRFDTLGMDLNLPTIGDHVQIANRHFKFRDKSESKKRGSCHSTKVPTMKSQNNLLFN